MRVPSVTALRSRPRKPLHRIGATAGAATAGLPVLAGAASPGGIPASRSRQSRLLRPGSRRVRSPLALPTVGRPVAQVVSFRVAASSCSSAVGDHRQASCALASPLIPSVRARIHTPLPRTIAAVIVAHRTGSDDRRDRMAPATRASGTVAGSSHVNSTPLFTPPIDGSATSCVTMAARAIRSTAPILCNHAARLKRSHHKRMIPPPTMPARMPILPSPSTKGAMTKRPATRMMAPATPGQTRSGLSGEDSGAPVDIVNGSVQARAFRTMVG